MAQIALSRVLLIAGAGYTSSILVRNGKLSKVLSELQDGKICSLEEKQDFTNMGVAYLCNFVSGKKIEMPGNLQGLKEIAESLSSRLSTDGIMQDDIAKLDESPKKSELKLCLRSVSSNC